MQYIAPKDRSINEMRDIVCAFSTRIDGETIEHPALLEAKKLSKRIVDLQNISDKVLFEHVNRILENVLNNELASYQRFLLTYKYVRSTGNHRRWNRTEYIEQWVQKTDRDARIFTIKLPHERPYSRSQEALQPSGEKADMYQDMLQMQDN